MRSVLTPTSRAPAGAWRGPGPHREARPSGSGGGCPRRSADTGAPAEPRSVPRTNFLPSAVSVLVHQRLPALRPAGRLTEGKCHMTLTVYKGSTAPCCFATTDGDPMASGNTRLATWISADVDERLRLQALLNRQRLSQLITDLLDEALPSAAALTAQLQGARHDAR